LSLHLQSTFRSISDIMEKDDSSPVTIADLSLQAIIIDKLSKNFPNDKFIAEEDSRSLRTDSVMSDSIVKVYLDYVRMKREHPSM
jgi:3'-phosphoadenosine 5'-phosphosulfate (PAPS) 3'-phosphatase